MLKLCIAVLAAVLILHCGLFSNAVPASRTSCPPALPIDVCYARCGGEDGEACNENQLCCPTSCGGFVCSDPVTTRVNTTLVKHGRCPEEAEGEWVCSDRCTSDGDCRRKLKCCKNRCGALACTRPVFL